MSKLQGTPEWFAARLGKLSASQISDIMKKPRSKTEKFTKTAITYMYSKLAEKLTGKREEAHGAALDWGTEWEEIAIKAYEMMTSKDVQEAPFIPLVGFEEWAGGSPDGIIDDGKGIIEVKCPYTSKMHVETMVTGAIPETYKDKYYAQMQMNMACTGAEYCDFISYDPRFKEDKDTIIIRITRDNEYIAELLSRLQEAIEWMKSTGVLK